MSGTPSPQQQNPDDVSSSQGTKRSIDFDYWASRRPQPDPKRSRDDDDGSPQIITIAELTTGEYSRSSIQCRVTLKKIFETLKEDGVKKTLNVHFMDASGEIAAVAFSQYSEQMIAKFELNHCYTIGNFAVHAEEKNYPSYSGHNCKIRLRENSVINELSDQNSVPPINFNFKSLDTVALADNGERSDYLGVCVKNWGLSNNYGKISRYLTLFDKSTKSVRVTLWNNSAEEFGNDENVLVALRKAVASTYNDNKFLDTRGYSLIWKNPEVEDDGLMTWFTSLD